MSPRGPAVESGRVRPTTALRLKVAGTCAVIFGLGMLSTPGPADTRTPSADRAPTGVATSTEGNPDGWTGPLPRRGPVEVLSKTELPPVSGFPAAAPDDDADPVVVRAGTHGWSALRADRPHVTEAQLSAPARSLPGLSASEHVADVRALADGLVQAVVVPLRPSGQGRLLTLRVTADAASVVDEVALFEPADAVTGTGGAVVADSVGSRTYVLRGPAEGRTVQVVVLTDGVVTGESTVDLPSVGDARPERLAVSPDGRSAVLVYADDTDTRVAAFSAEPALRYATSLGKGLTTADATIDDAGAVLVVRPGTDASGESRAWITRFSPDGVPDRDRVRIDDYLYVDGVALGPVDRRTGEGRWLYVSGLSEATGVLGVVVIDLRSGAVVADVGLCSDYADGISTRPEVSSDRWRMTVAGDCFMVPTVHQLEFEPRA